ncbi:tripartite motif-containing protein 29 isoform X2 [Microcaecilia unicolor]|uniref:Tripartite motif-containing protein 29 isoform X2 n=1 Tax=Microcaecilia unicolor TaxID=1415580 RepID=A0A6P7ZLT8_9AMPH|nr:tripartite motif-containing protein 29 isoform X2 [Microcaecilia unicolor]
MDTGEVKTGFVKEPEKETPHCPTTEPENKSLLNGSSQMPEEVNGASPGTEHDKPDGPSFEKHVSKETEEANRRNLSGSEADDGKKNRFGLELDAKRPLRPTVESGDLKKLNRLNSEPGNLKSPTNARIEPEHANPAIRSILELGGSKAVNRPVLQPVDTKKANRFGQELGDSPKGYSPKSSSPRSLGEDVLCDSCIDFKKKAVKSCLVCQTSFCEIHLKPHLEGAAFRDHKLLEPIKDFEARKCQLHFKTMELFCQTDQTCICYLCMFQEHKNHCTVTVEAEKYVKEAELSERQEQLHLEIMNVGDEVEKWHKEKDRLRNYTTNQKGAVDNAFKDIVKELQRQRDEVKAGLEQKERAAVEQVEQIVKDLQVRREELQDRQQDGDRLLHTTDAVLFLQEFQEVIRNVPALPPLPSYNVFLEGEKLTQAMVGLRDDLTGLCKKHVEKVCRNDFNKNLVERVNTDNRYMMKDYTAEWNQPDSYRRFSSLLTGKGPGVGRTAFQTSVHGRPLIDTSQSLSSIYGTKGTYTSRMWDHSPLQTQEEPANQGSSAYPMKASSPLSYSFSSMGPASPEATKTENSLFNMNAYPMMSRQQTPKTQPQTWKSSKQSLLSHQRPFYVNKGKSPTSNESP